MGWATTSDGVSLAYQVFGDGAIVLVIIPPFAQNIELAWEWPETRRMFERMGQFARVVHFDKRGTGVSNRTAPVPGLDQRVDDTRAVMDAAGVDTVCCTGCRRAGRWRSSSRVSYPERVDRLVLHATDACFVDLDHETAEQRERRRWGAEGTFSAWGTDDSRLLQHMAPTVLNPRTGSGPTSSSTPEQHGVFVEAMTALAHGAAAGVVATIDFSPYRTVADIAGGRGHLLCAIVERNPQVHGVLFDLPEVIDIVDAPTFDCRAGDFFADALPTVDLSILMQVIHDWDDEDAAWILSAVAAAATPGSALDAVRGGHARAARRRRRQHRRRLHVDRHRRPRADRDRVRRAARRRRLRAHRGAPGGGTVLCDHRPAPLTVVGTWRVGHGRRRSRRRTTSRA